MAKIFLFMMVTADGYFEGQDHDITWHNTDDEFEEFANAQLDDVETVILGKRTYDLFEEFWPSDYAKKHEPETAKRMAAKRKMVFSHEDFKPKWENVEVVTNNVATLINDLRDQSDKDIALLASSNLCETLFKNNLIDELRLMVNPVILGKGTQLFSGLGQTVPLKLKSSRVFENGNVLNIYSVTKL